MEVTESGVAFNALSPADQIEMLACLAHELTVIAREGYDIGADGLAEPAFVRAVNEVQHRVTAHLAALLRCDARRYPDALLVEIILGHSDPVRRERIAAAFDRAMGAVAQPV